EWWFFWFNAGVSIHETHKTALFLLKNSSNSGLFSSFL
ncbi:hypothetical protein, partial [uncultured Gammaproteobacteria bacterium]